MAGPVTAAGDPEVLSPAGPVTAAGDPEMLSPAGPVTATWGKEVFFKGLVRFFILLYILP